MALVKKRIKMGELFDLYAVNPNINNEIVKTKVPVYVKGESGNIIKLNGVIRKTNSKMLHLKFEDNINLKCASKHLLKIGNNFKFAEDIILNKDKVKIKNKKIKLLEKNVISENSLVYDICMESEHVYKTPNGLTHHNSMIVGGVLGAAQRKYQGRSMVAYLDSEEAVTSIRLANLGAKYPRIKPYQDITVEKVFKFLEGLCLFREEKNLLDVPAIVVWDSIANTITQKEREVDDINQVIGLKARMLSILLPKYVAKMSQYKICLLAVNQLREVLSMGPYSAPRDLKMMSASVDMPGGKSLKFNAFHLAEMKIKKILELNRSDNKFPFDGVITSIKLAKNKLFPPNIPIEVIGNFKTGFSNFWTNFNFLCTSGRLKPGGWNYLVNAPELKFRTKDAEISYNTDPNFKKYFDEAVSEAIQTEIIDKNTK